MDDIRAVLDAVGSERAVLFGFQSMGRLCLLFAATYPEQTEALVTFGTLARPPEGDRSAVVREVRMRWGERDLHALGVKEGMDREYVDWWVNLNRLAASPGAAAHYTRMVQETDVSDIVSAVHVPALVFHGSYGDPAWDLGQQELGQQLRNAQMVHVGEMASPWHVPELIPELRRFLADHERGDVPDSVLTTLLFTDIVRSTERTAAVGDRAWRDLLAAHQQAARREIARFRGRELDTAGDGFFASFDGPARAIKCAQKIVSAATGQRPSDPRRRPYRRVRTPGRQGRRYRSQHGSENRRPGQRRGDSRIGHSQRPRRWFRYRVRITRRSRAERTRRMAGLRGGSIAKEGAPCELNAPRVLISAVSMPFGGNRTRAMVRRGTSPRA